jgi:hypothetical protein
VCTQDVAQYYGDSLSAAFAIDATHKLCAQSGLGYAEGGATVATPANLYDFLADVIGNVVIPVNQQVSSYLATHGSPGRAGRRSSNFCKSSKRISTGFLQGSTPTVGNEQSCVGNRGLSAGLVRTSGDRNE